MMIGVLHIGIASALHAPEVALKDDEAKALANATARVLEEFDIRPNPKVEAIVNLAFVATPIYGSRIWLIRERKKAERNEPAS